MQKRFQQSMLSEGSDKTAELELHGMVLSFKGNPFHSL